MQYLSHRLAVESPDARAATAIEAIVMEAGVSSVTFYEHFEDKEGCFLAAYERAVGGLDAEVRGAIPT